MYNIGNLPCKSLHACFRWNRNCPLSHGSILCINSSSKAESAAPWRCRHPAHWPALLQTAWSLGAPRPLVDPAGRTPLGIPPRSPAAVSTRRSCPAGPQCRHIPPAGPSWGCYGAESAGLSRGGCTVREDSQERVSDISCPSCSFII